MGSESMKRRMRDESVDFEDMGVILAHVHGSSCVSLQLCLYEGPRETVRAVQEQWLQQVKIETHSTQHSSQNKETRHSIPFPPATWRSRHASFKLGSHKVLQMLVCSRKNCVRALTDGPREIMYARQLRLTNLHLHRQRLDRQFFGGPRAKNAPLAAWKGSDNPS